MKPPTGVELLQALEYMLEARVHGLSAVLDDLGQIHAVEQRKRGEAFSLREHVRGLVLSLLSNQRPWLPIARMLPEIEVALLEFDPDLLEAAPPIELEERIRDLKAGNRAIAAQMRTLAANIRTLRKIERDKGSLDAFVTSAAPEDVAGWLADDRGPYKLKQVGVPLAMEYLRNVGISSSKPDTHVLRILGAERLGYLEAGPVPEDAIRVVHALSLDAGVSATELDTLIWLFGAQGYGEICTSSPQCDVCTLRAKCRTGVRSLN